MPPLARATPIRPARTAGALGALTARLSSAVAGSMEKLDTIFTDLMQPGEIAA
jgi:hypothetical protein